MLKKFLHPLIYWAVPLYFANYLVNVGMYWYYVREDVLMKSRILGCGSSKDRVYAIRQLNAELFANKINEMEYWLWERGFWNRIKSKMIFEKRQEQGLIDPNKYFDDLEWRAYRLELATEVKRLFYDEKHNRSLDACMFFWSPYDLPTPETKKLLFRTVKTFFTEEPLYEGNPFMNDTDWQFGPNDEFHHRKRSEDGREGQYGDSLAHNENSEDCKCMVCDEDALLARDEYKRVFNKDVYDGVVKNLRKVWPDTDAPGTMIHLNPYEVAVYLRVYNEFKEDILIIEEEIRQERLAAMQAAKENEKSPLDSFLVLNDNSSFFFNNLLIDLIIYSFVPLFFIILIFYNSLKLKNLNKFYILVSKLFNIFYKIFKNLIASVRSERFFSIILAVFIFIVFSNLAGFFMLELPITSHAIITLFLSFIMFFNYSITSLIVNNENFYKHFLLKKLNIILKIILFFIEFVSYIVRPFSLGVRLFSNILSGHILIHIFFGAFLYAYKLSLWISVIAFVMVLFILTMELFVSFVQSYIFFILNIIYLQDIFIKH